MDDSEKTCLMFNALGGKAMKIDKKEDTITYLKKILEEDKEIKKS